TDRLSGFGLGSITISGASSLAVAAGANLSVIDGGGIKLTGATTVDGAITAHGGNISLNGVSPMLGGPTTLPYLIVGASAVLDATGRWINDSGQYGEDYSGARFINGGSVAINTFNLSQNAVYNAATQAVTATDRSSSIVLRQGSIIDVSSGG